MLSIISQYLCDYKQTSAKKAFIGQIILGLFGFGYYYIGLTFYGNIQITVFILLFTGLLTLPCIIYEKFIELHKKLTILTLIGGLGSYIYWWIYVTILVKQLNINDYKKLTILTLIGGCMWLY